MKENGFIAEFKKFIMRGNVIDMAVGVVIGGAFKAIVDSLVADIINPIIGAIFSTEGLAEVVISAGAAEIAIGKFIAAIINFLIVAFVLFCVIKGINALKDAAAKKEEEKPEEPAPAPEPTKEEVLLTEIRDLLKK